MRSCECTSERYIFSGLPNRQECLCYSGELSQCGRHFRSRMFVTRAESGDDTGVQRGTGLFRAAGLCQELAILEISRDIVRM